MTSFQFHPNLMIEIQRGEPRRNIELENHLYLNLPQLNLPVKVIFLPPKKLVTCTILASLSSNNKMCPETSTTS